MSAPAQRQAGQASIELVALLPLLAAVALAAAQVLAAGAAWVFAGHAAEAGAVAMLEGGPAADAARAAVPGWSREGVAVSIEGQAVRVALRPPTIFPALAGLLTAHAEAVAGP
jgi:hypothetical protein